MAIFVFRTINTTRNFAVLIENPKFAVMLGGLLVTDHPSDHPTDGGTDTPSYRVASSRLKINKAGYF